MLCVTESHLVQSVSNSFVDIPDYRVVRKDTTGNVAKHGVCMYICESIKFENIDITCPNCLCINLPELGLYIVAVYRPPSNTQDDNQVLLSFLLSVCSDKETLVMGDFNLPSILWGNLDPALHISVTDRLFYEAFLLLGLTQWVFEPTFPRSSNILDLILSTEDDRVASVQILAPLPGCDHCPTLCHYVFDHVTASHNAFAGPRRRWHKGRYDLIARRLEAVDWDHELNFRSCQGAYDRFVEIVTPLVEDFVPISDTRRHTSRPPWHTNPPSSMRNRRKEAWLRFKETRFRLGRNSVAARETLRSFLHANHALKNYALCSQSEFEKHLIQELNTNPKQFHAYIRRKKVGCPAVGPLRLPGGTLTDDPGVMAELFASSFESVYVRSAPDTQPAPHQIANSRMPSIQVSFQDVLQVLQSLDTSSAAGADDIHPALLKTCARQLASPLLKIFRLSLSECHLPSQWKSTIVVPIFKKGSRYDPLNYRPVSLTSVTGKCLERVIVGQLTAYLEDHYILSEHQFGFRSGRSTMDQLLLVYNNVSEWLDQGSVVDLILFDFSKAFDVVSHPILLVKLQHLGVDRSLLSWIEHFLTNRTMSVTVKGKLSTGRLVASGVPQGSVLGPILFLVFINNIAANLTCSYKIFADDLKIYMRMRHDSNENHSADKDICQRDITTLHEVACSWSLRLNESKCAVLRFQRRSHVLPPPHYHVNQSPIRIVQSHGDLGVQVDNELKFHSHVATITHKAAGLAQNLVKATVCRSPDFMMSLFCTHIRPILEYASCVWNTGYIGDLRLLESVQRRWTKRVLNLSNLDYQSRLRTLDQYSVTGRLLRNDLIQYWKIFHGKCSVNALDMFTMAPQSATRGHSFKISHVRTQTDVRRRAFAVRCIEEWNSLPDHVVSETDLKSFKGLLADSLGDKLYNFPI